MEERIGAGGMGEVYRARDPRPGRAVAIKILPPDLAARVDLRQRFEVEARAIASLNHPHICAVYDIGEQDGVAYLVMEYLEGESLAQRLKKGPLPVAETLRHAIHIAQALEQAHRRGVVHRDIKPGNIMLTKAGVKLLDFGLARLRQSGDAAEAGGMPLTREGTVLGTLPYMAPEQLEGKEADARADIFAFGSVLYEMLSGQRAYTGDTQAKLMIAILQGDPPPIANHAPAPLARVLNTCWVKDPDERWQSAGDLRKELVWIADGGEAKAEAPARASRRELVAWGTAAVFGAAGAASVIRA
jgi:serine/threonine protein kinase